MLALHRMDGVDGIERVIPDPSVLDGNETILLAALADRLEMSRRDLDPFGLEIGLDLRDRAPIVMGEPTKDILATAQRLGHTSTRMVDSTYVELYAEVSRQAADAIDEAAKGAANASAAGPARDQRGTGGPQTSGRGGETRP